MATKTTPPPVGTEIRSLLRRVRWRIRLYVWIEGFSLAVVWLCLTFWIGLAVDYLPVMAGASEMPRTARVVLLGVIAIVLAFILFKWIFRRTFVRMPDHRMALLLERRFGRFDDALVTAVEMSNQPEHAETFNRNMLEQTAQDARSKVAGVPVRDLFRLAPLLTKFLIAVAVAASIAIFYSANAQAVTIWANRLYLLKDQAWPRNTHIRIAGIQIQRTSETDGSQQLSTMIPFSNDREIKIAKGTSVVLNVTADAAKTIPEFCTVHYRTGEDEQGQVTMPKLGRIRDHVQIFAFDGKPFRGVLSSLDFDVRGLDHRVRDYRLTVVPSPVIIETKLDCVFPSYIVDEELSLWMPRTLDLASGTQLPLGTQITIRAFANKDLTKVDIQDDQGSATTTIDLTRNAAESTPENTQENTLDRRSFEYVVPALKDSLTLKVTLHDTDGVISDPPHTIFIAGIQDQPPVVHATLHGIGTAITANAMIPARGRIDDDYDIDRCWFEAFVNDGERKEFDFTLKQNRQVDAAIDFRAMKSEPDESKRAITLKPKDKLTITVMAADKYDLGDQANIGVGDRYQLDVVTADELLAMLERRELNLRRRFEQVIDELSEMRDSLSRIRSDEATGDEATERAQSLRLLRTQRAAMQSQKSAQEILGIAESFDDIREELVNNRIDSEDRQIRLREQIVKPLRMVCQTMFPDLDRQITQLEEAIPDPIARDIAADKVTKTTESILLELDKVLQKMLELETFNELVNVVRSLIERQKELVDETKKERIKRARSLLE